MPLFSRKPSAADTLMAQRLNSDEQDTIYEMGERGLRTFVDKVMTDIDPSHPHRQFLPNQFLEKCLSDLPPFLFDHLSAQQQSQLQDLIKQGKPEQRATIADRFFALNLKNCTSLIHEFEDQQRPRFLRMAHEMQYPGR